MVEKSTRNQISPTGFWVSNEDSEHCFVRKLALEMIKYVQAFNISSVYDFGCGKGDYLQTLFEFRPSIVATGFEGHQTLGTFTNIVKADLSEPLNFEQVDMVISIEVGEHIPKAFEQNFLDNLANHARSHIFLSWAIEGQGGLGHVNCQNNEYIIAQLKIRGWQFRQDLSDQIRQAMPQQHYWLRNTVMIFQKYSNGNGFDQNIGKKILPTWFSGIAHNFRLVPQLPLRALQIGAFTGDATDWLLENRDVVYIDDVDTWAGDEYKEFDELKDYNSISWSDVEEFYDFRFKNEGRVQKFKMSSDNFFANSSIRTYNFIYIDGAHFALETARDGLAAFRSLESGGVLAFDDYLWDILKDPFRRPKRGVDAVLSVCMGQYKILEVGQQVWIQKI